MVDLSIVTLNYQRVWWIMNSQNLLGCTRDVQARSQLQELILRKHSTEQMQAQQICFREILWEIRGFYPQRPRFSYGFLWIFTVKVGQTWASCGQSLVSELSMATNTLDLVSSIERAVQVGMAIQCFLLFFQQGFQDDSLRWWRTPKSVASSLSTKTLQRCLGKLPRLTADGFNWMGNIYKFPAIFMWREGDSYGWSANWGLVLSYPICLWVLPLCLWHRPAWSDRRVHKGPYRASGVGK